MTQQQDRYIRDNYRVKTQKEIAQDLNISRDRVNAYMQQQALLRPQPKKEFTQVKPGYFNVDKYAKEHII